jgi:hypothetical protein
VALFLAGLVLGDRIVDLLIGRGDPHLGRELRLDRAVDDLLEDVRDERARVHLVVQGLDLRVGLGLGEAAGRDLGLDLVDLLLEPERLDVRAIGELVLRDRLAIDRRGSGEVVPIPGRRRNDDEDEDGDDDRQAEADVHPEGPPVGIAAEAAAVDGPHSNGHGVMRS